MDPDDRGTPGPNLRPGRVTDIPRLIEIRTGVAENRIGESTSLTRDDYHTSIDQARLWVSEADGRVVGYGCWLPDGVLWALFVDPTFEDEGHGSALHDRLVAELTAAGHSEAALATEPGTRAEAFYRHKGWIESERTESGELTFLRRLP